MVHKTQDEDKQDKNAAQKTKKMSNTDPSISGGEPRYNMIHWLLIRLLNHFTF